MLRILRWILPGLLALTLAGCLPTIAPPYKGGLAQEPTGLTPYEDSAAGISMALAPGWKAQATNDPSDPELKAKLEKPGTGASLLVYCQGAFVSRTALQIKLLNLITATTVSNQRLWPDQSMGGGNFDPEFSAWTGIVDSQGKKVSMNFYLAWKLPSSFGCKYGLWSIVPTEKAKGIEGDFLAMVRSLK